MNVYKIFFEGNLIKEYKYRRCMIKYINKLRQIEFSRSVVHEDFDQLTDRIYVVDNFGQIMFV